MKRLLKCENIPSKSQKEHLPSQFVKIHFLRCVKDRLDEF
jgi:hypothetical protein